MNKLWVKVLMLGACAGLLAAQAAPPPRPSLADLARKARADKASAPKAKRSFDNDTIPKTTVLSSEGMGPAPAAKPEGEAKAGDAKEGEAKPGEAKPADAKPAEKPKEEESVWRARFAKLRQTLDLEKRRADVLQRELNLAQVQSYSDPNQAMREQFARTEINKRVAELDAQKQVVAAAQKALDDALEEARKKSIPPAWTEG